MLPCQSSLFQHWWSAPTTSKVAVRPVFKMVTDHMYSIGSEMKLKTTSSALLATILCYFKIKYCFLLVFLQNTLGLKPSLSLVHPLWISGAEMQWHTKWFSTPESCLRATQSGLVVVHSFPAARHPLSDRRLLTCSNENSRWAGMETGGRGLTLFIVNHEDEVGGERRLWIISLNPAVLHYLSLLNSSQKVNVERVNRDGFDLESQFLALK